MVTMAMVAGECVYGRLKGVRTKLGKMIRRSQLSRLTEQLAPADRLLLELLYVQKLGATEIASTLRIQKGAVYTRKTRLIKRLRELAKESDLAD